jgi:pyridoxamine 5'-phosphate oxidase
MSRQYEIFDQWFNEARAAALPQYEAMALVTATAQGKPSARMVLLKGVVSGCFRFFTNYDSRKAHEILSNPQAQLLFYWPALGKQIRIEGTVRKISPQESDEYFMTRPRESRLGAIASTQSRPLESLDILKKKIETVTQGFAGKEVTRPSGWGGYDLDPDYFEFWLDGENRIHERITFIKDTHGTWTSSRLWP